MVALNMVDLDQHREQRARSELVASLHRAFEEWFFQWEQAMKHKGSQPTLWEITETLREHRQDLMARVAKGWLEEQSCKTDPLPVVKN